MCSMVQPCYKASTATSMHYLRVNYGAVGFKYFVQMAASSLDRYSCLRYGLRDRVSTTMFSGPCVRCCSCVVHMPFMFYLCSIAVHSWLHWFALVVVRCSQDALQPITVHYKTEKYSGICASICPLVVMYVKLFASRLA